MNISTMIASLALAGGSVIAHDTIESPTAPSQGAVVNLAICLDTSGSMDGLIDATRRNIWTVINDLALAEPTPRLRISLLTFGNDGHAKEDGWVRVHTPLTGDLDLISEELFAQSTDGGTELVGRVIDRAVSSLDWGTDADALKIIIVAGNESADQDKTILYQDACRRAISKGIMVNSIYCGSPGDSEAEAWRNVSRLADGAFATIDKDKAVVNIPTPFDAELVQLNESVNKTYIAYGEKGWVGLARQQAEDDNATELGGAVVAQRLACKSTTLYDNTAWDLVDACTNKTVDLETIDVEDLPENMRAMTLEERKAYVATKQGERATLSEQVAGVVKQRDVFRLNEQKRLAIDESTSLGSILRKAIRAQAAAKGLRFTDEDPVALIDAIEPTAAANADGGSTP